MPLAQLLKSLHCHQEIISLLSFVDKNIVPGEKTKALVLHVDALTSKVYVSLREELLKQRAKQVCVQFLDLCVSVHLANSRQLMNFEGELFRPLELWEVKWRESKSQQEKSLSPFLSSSSQRTPSTLPSCST